MHTANSLAGLSVLSGDFGRANDSSSDWSSLSVSSVPSVSSLPHGVSNMTLMSSITVVNRMLDTCTVSDARPARWLKSVLKAPRRSRRKWDMRIENILKNSRYVRGGSQQVVIWWRSRNLRFLDVDEIGCPSSILSSKMVITCVDHRYDKYMALLTPGKACVTVSTMVIALSNKRELPVDE